VELIENPNALLKRSADSSKGCVDPNNTCKKVRNDQIPDSIDELQDSLLYLLQSDLSILDCPGKLIDNFVTLGYEFL
jgi:hypothetical protein